MLRSENGFTLIELVLVLTLISILAIGVAAPRFVDVQSAANSAQRDATAAAIYDGLQAYFSDAIVNSSGAYPATLDAAPVGACVLQGDLNQLCFSSVLQIGVTRNWNKTGAQTYTHTGTNSEFTYNDVTGSFVCTANC